MTKESQIIGHCALLRQSIVLNSLESIIYVQIMVSNSKYFNDCHNFELNFIERRLSTSFLPKNIDFNQSFKRIHFCGGGVKNKVVVFLKYELKTIIIEVRSTHARSVDPRNRH